MGVRHSRDAHPGAHHRYGSHDAARHRAAQQHPLQQQHCRRHCYLCNLRCIKQDQYAGERAPPPRITGALPAAIGWAVCSGGQSDRAAHWPILTLQLENGKARLIESDCVDLQIEVPEGNICRKCCCQRCLFWQWDGFSFEEPKSREQPKSQDGGDSVNEGETVCELEMETLENSLSSRGDDQMFVHWRRKHLACMSSGT